MQKNLNPKNTNNVSRGTLTIKPRYFGAFLFFKKGKIIMLQLLLKSGALDKLIKPEDIQAVIAQINKISTDFDQIKTDNDEIKKILAQPIQLLLVDISTRAGVEIKDE